MDRVSHFFSDLGSSVRSYIWGANEKTIIFIGENGCGKTQCLYRYCLPEEPITTIPTIGFNVETFDFGSKRITIWDAGGYFRNMFGLWMRSWADHQNLCGYCFFINITMSEYFPMYHFRIWTLAANSLHPIAIIISRADQLPANRRSEVVKKFMESVTRPPEPFEERRGEGPIQFVYPPATRVDNPENWVPTLKIFNCNLSIDNSEMDKALTWLLSNPGSISSRSIQGVTSPSDSTTFDTTGISSEYTASTSQSTAHDSKSTENNPLFPNKVKIRNFDDLQLVNQQNSLSPVFRLNLPVTPPKEFFISLFESYWAENANQEEFLLGFENSEGPIDHNDLIRYIFIILKPIIKTNKRRQQGVNDLFSSFNALSKEYHFTKVYFWIQFITLAIAAAPNLDFPDLVRKYPWLIYSDLIFFHYSRTLFSTENAQTSFQIPDLLPLPSILSPENNPSRWFYQPNETTVSETSTASSSSSS